MFQRAKGCLIFSQRGLFPHFDRFWNFWPVPVFGELRQGNIPLITFPDGGVGDEPPFRLPAGHPQKKDFLQTRNRLISVRRHGLGIGMNPCERIKAGWGTGLFGFFYMGKNASSAPIFFNEVDESINKGLDERFRFFVFPVILFIEQLVGSCQVYFRLLDDGHI